MLKENLEYFSITSFGKVVYDSKLKLDAAVKEYYGLKAVDSIRGTKEISEEKLNIINDKSNRTFLLDKYGVKILNY